MINAALLPNAECNATIIKDRSPKYETSQALSWDCLPRKEILTTRTYFGIDARVGYMANCKKLHWPAELQQIRCVG